MTSRISMNIDAKRVADRTALFRILDKLQPTTCGVMDGLGLAKDIKQRLPNAVIWHRSFGETEAWSDGTSPMALARAWKAQGYGEVLTYGINEPVPSGARPWGHIFNWLIVNMDAMREVGLKGVVGNIGPALFNRSDIDSGVFDGYLSAWDRHADWHYRGDHEYTGILAPWGGGWGGRAPEDLLDPAKVQPDQWTRPDEITDATDNWHLQRGRWLDARSKRLGYRVPRKIVTEALWDNMPDWELRPVNVYREITRRWGTSGYPVLRGQHTLRDYYRIMFPNWTFAQALAEQLKWVERVYPPDYVGFNLYQWCTGTEWDREYGFDLATLEGMFTMLVDSQAAPPPPPNPIPITTPVPKPSDAGAPVQARLKSGYNLRFGPSTRYGILAVLPPELTVTYYPNETTKTQADGFEWVYVQALGKEGFVAHQGQFEPLPALPPTTFWLLDPVRPRRITDRFNERRDYSKIAPGKLQLHEGIDLGPTPVGANVPVHAAQQGKVIVVANDPNGYGNYVKVQHDWEDGETWFTLYAHLAAARVSAGSTVDAGDVIGTMGETGNADGVHLHLTLTNARRGLDGYSVDKVVDPEPFLRESAPVVEPPPPPDPVDYKALYEAAQATIAEQQLTIEHLQAVMAAQAPNIRTLMLLLLAGRADLEKIALALESHAERVTAPVATSATVSETIATVTVEVKADVKNEGEAA